MRSSGLTLLAGCLVMVVVVAPLHADDELFRERVAPILERRCVSCHRGDAPKGGLSLTTAEGIAAGGESGAAIVPGDADASLLVAYVSGDEPEMPKNAEPLTAEEVSALREWVAAGAVWPADVVLVDRRFEGQTWWSLAPVAQPAVPDAGDAFRHPIDAFLQTKRQEQGLTPSSEADRRTLIRRLTYDLHGLPPTREEVAAFLADEAPEAYERLVDRLLASPRYGERWGRHWLDTVHFGETHGYDKDKTRPNAWPYRDYTIEAFNADKPYSRFVEEQLAGDVLYPDSPAAIVATGFIAAGPWDFVGHVELREGTVDKLIARTNDRDDMLMAAVSTFASMTAHCARCHDHKFDPIPQRDYYRLQAVFAGVDRADRPYDADPAIARRRQELQRERKSLDARRAELDILAGAVSSPEIVVFDERLVALAAELAAIPIEPAEASPSLGYHSAIMPSPDETKWVQVDLGASLPLDEITIVPAHVAYGGHPGPGFGFPPRFKVEVSDEQEFAAGRIVADETAADFPHPGDAPYTIALDGATARYVRITATKLWKRTDDWIFAVSELIVRSQGRNVAAGAAVTSLDSIEAPPGWAMTNLVDGYNSQTLLEAPPESNAARREAVSAQLAAMQAERRRLVDALLDPAVRAERAEIDQRLSEVDRESAALPPQQVVYAAVNGATSDQPFVAAAGPRPIYLLARGDVKSPGDLMSAGALSCFPDLERHFQLDPAADEGRRRAALARWITDPANPLTRRSIVNRVWHYHFGRGIVDTPNDFGRMGSLPTHPELLDWLAAEFLRQGESFKWLHKLIVTSAAYRQTSTDDPHHALVDADNRYLWRMNRQRLDAESVRDAALFVAGQLDLTMGGPSDQQFYFQDDHSPVYDYTRFDIDSPQGRRRSVYRFVVRSVPDPFMDCMDCADPSLLVPKRNTTLTALQALALLNNPFMVRQAEHLADRVRAMAADPAEQIVVMFQLGLARPPQPEERDLLAGYAAEHGLENACRLILNSNEFLFVD